MSETPDSSKWNEQAQRDVYQAFHRLYDELKNAYFDAKTRDDKKRIKDRQDAISDILTSLNRGFVEAQTDQFAALEHAVKDVMPRLHEVREEIQELIGYVEQAGKITKAVDKVIESADKYLL